MAVILEGPDGGGKSTLAAYIHHLSPKSYVRSSEGPEQWPGEINDRIAGYADELFTWDPQCLVVVDRHPAVSHEIYRHFSGAPAAKFELIDAFYAQPHLLVYCAGPEQLEQVEGIHDTPEHLKLLQHNYQGLRRLYDIWALKRAHALYNRYRDDMELTARRILAMTGA